MRDMSSNHVVPIHRNEHSPSSSRVEGSPGKQPGRSEQDAMHAQTRFRDMVDRCAESVFIVHHGVIAGCNAEARRVFGAPGGDALAGRALGEVLHDADHADLPVLPERSLQESLDRKSVV